MKFKLINHYTNVLKDYYRPESDLDAFEEKIKATMGNNELPLKALVEVFEAVERNILALSLQSLSYNEDILARALHTREIQIAFANGFKHIIKAKVE